MKRLLSCPLIIVACMSASCRDAPDAPAAGDVPTTSSRAIIQGEDATDYPFVVSLRLATGSLCSATVMAPRVVLTARHCIEDDGQLFAAADITVRLGINTNQFEREVAVEDVRVPHDARYQDGNQTPIYAGADIAVLVTAEPIDEVAPARLRRAPPEELIDQPVTLVGFGQQDTGVLGRRMKRTVTFNGVNDLLVYADDAICGGDSGGPMFDAEGAIVGVASFSASGCEVREDLELHSKFAAVVKLPGLVDEALRDTGACDATVPEACDGYDNDCDDEVDEGCAAAGDPCAVPEDCANRLACADDGGGRVCSIPCAPDGVVDGYLAVSACPNGLVCARSASSCFVGTCRAPGGGAEGDACDSDDACASQLCAVDADGVSRCRAPCLGEDGVCREGLVCAVDGDGCGTCLEDDAADGCAGTGAPSVCALLAFWALRRPRRRAAMIAATLVWVSMTACGVDDAPETALEPYERPELLLLAPECPVTGGIDQPGTPSDEEGDMAVQRMNVPGEAFDVLEIGVSVFGFPSVDSVEVGGDCGCGLPVSLLAIIGVAGPAGALPAAPRVIYEPAPIARQCLAQEHVIDRPNPPLDVREGETLWVGARWLRDGDEVTCLAACGADPGDDALIDGALVDGVLGPSYSVDARLIATAVASRR